MVYATSGDATAFESYLSCLFCHACFILIGGAVSLDIGTQAQFSKCIFQANSASDGGTFRYFSCVSICIDYIMICSLAYCAGAISSSTPSLFLSSGTRFESNSALGLVCGASSGYGGAILSTAVAVYYILPLYIHPFEELSMVSILYGRQVMGNISR